jgi:hypothetical protein
MERRALGAASRGPPLQFHLGRSPCVVTLSAAAPGAEDGAGVGTRPGRRGT